MLFRSEWEYSAAMQSTPKACHPLSPDHSVIPSHEMPGLTDRRLQNSDLVWIGSIAYVAPRRLANGGPPVASSLCQTVAPVCNKRLGENPSRFTFIPLGTHPFRLSAEHKLDVERNLPKYVKRDTREIYECNHLLPIANPRRHDRRGNSDQYEG